MWTDGQTDRTKLIGAFRNSAKAPENVLFFMVALQDSPILQFEFRLFIQCVIVSYPSISSVLYTQFRTKDEHWFD